MEYVDGEDLSAVLAWVADGHRFPVDVAAHVGAELADALEHAHRAGVVHRAVSPTSVLFSLAGEVKLGDFGSARGDQAATGPDDVRSVGALVRSLLASEDKVPGELDRIIERAERGDFATAGELAAALRDFRYSAATSSGEPGRELAGVLRRVAAAPQHRKGVETSVVVELAPVDEFRAVTPLPVAVAGAEAPPDRQWIRGMLALLAFAAGVVVAAILIKKLTGR
jgi:serine/threonine protein kinase